MADSAFQRPILDHIVVLVSELTLRDLPSKLRGTLIVAEGGNHADGLTTNRLILFRDGVYIELIAFFDNIDPEKRRKHRWGQLEEGSVIDWACTLPSESDFGLVQERIASANVGYAYGDPVAGGRVKPDGTVLQWSVASARDAAGDPNPPGQLPFWCLDRTPRKLRVPYKQNPDQTEHPSGAQGISRVSVVVPSGRLGVLSRAYDAVFRDPGQAAEPTEGWNFGVPSNSLSDRRHLSLAEGSQSSIVLTLLGSAASPARIELLPGLLLEMET